MPMFRYTKFRTLPGPPVVQLLNHQRGILLLSESHLAFHNPRGVSVASVLPKAAGDSARLVQQLTCMAVAYLTSNDVIVGGRQSLFKVDLARPSTLLPFAHAGDAAFVNYLLKLLTIGTRRGAVEIFDPAANTSVKCFAGLSGALLDMDVKGNYVATCGYLARSRRLNELGPGPAHAVEYMVDPLVNLYDLRMMRALPPVPFAAGANHVRFHPKLANIIIVAALLGQLQFIDITDSLAVHIYHADVLDPAPLALLTTQPPQAYLDNLCVSENGEFLAFNDSRRHVHLWSLAALGNFLNFPSKLEQPDPPAEPVPPATLDDKVPLNSVGMPYYKEYLASNFPSDMVFTKAAARVPRNIALDVALHETPYPDSRVRPYDRARYGPRYVVPEYKSLKAAPSASKPGKKQPQVPKFISERSVTASPKPRDLPTATGGLGSASEATDPALGEPRTPKMLSAKMFRPEFDSPVADDLGARTQPGDNIFQYWAGLRAEVPACYTKFEIQYSRFGVDDFDFSYYNRSGGLLAGLENHSDNLYVNALLQIYRHIPIFYNTITRSLLQEYLPSDSATIHDKQNPQGLSILNELAYLFDMMHNAGPRNVNISNFSLILSESNIAKAHGLLNKDDGKTLDAAELQRLIVMFNKFLVESAINDYAAQFGDDIQDLTAMHYKLEYHAALGELLDQNYAEQATLDLVTPPSSVLNHRGGALALRYLNVKKNHTILTYLDYSLNQLHAVRADSNVEVKQTLKNIGPVLLVNLPFADAEFSLLKSFKKWLVPEFYTLVNSSKRMTFKTVVTQHNQQAEKYELAGYVCQVSHGPHQSKGQHNLVSYVKMRTATGREQWYLFNDFLVMPIPEEEVFDLTPLWKRPVVIVYQNVEDLNNQAFSYFDSRTFARLPGLNDLILYRDHFAYGTREGHRKEYELLTREEAPAYGSLVAIDAEFVSLRPDVAEISYTGRRNMVRPTLMSLARVSVLRGDAGAKYAVPFIDDYILHCKPIYDYLTTFSGIEDGDLDPARLKKTLVTLQTAYRKLWLLLNLGCVFVGHGLMSDFRCINLQVPRAQIKDTIEFYYLPDFRRKLSLKFLAHVVLAESVQARNHDLIEDAYTALLLYKRYLELQALGDFEQELLRIYMEGQQLRFRVPE